MPGLELLAWVIGVAAAYLVASGLVALLSILGARASWHASRPAAAAERVTWIVLVPDVVLVVLFFTPTLQGVQILTALPSLIAFATLMFIRIGNRRRGHPSLGRPPVVRSVLSSLAGTMLLIVFIGIGIRMADARAKRLHEEAIARGQRDQDEFAALAITDRDIVVAGSTSTPPAVSDDAWMLVLDRALAPVRRYAPPVLERQAFFALAADGEDIVAGGQDDERPFWLRIGRTGDVMARMRWPAQGGIHGIASSHAGATLVVGERSDAPFISCVDSFGTELWSRSPASRGRLRAVVCDGHRYLAAGPEDPLEMPGCTAILVGGTTDGKISWEKQPSPSDLAVPHALAMAPGGGYVALGTTRDLPGHMADLWLARIAEDGTISDERILGGEPNEDAGGIATMGDRIFVAAYRFVWPEEELWLLELDGKGNKVWEKTYGANTHGRPLALASTRDGHLVAAGYRQAADGHRDGWVAVFDTTGQLLAQRTYP